MNYYPSQAGLKPENFDLYQDKSLQVWYNLGNYEYDAVSELSKWGKNMQKQSQSVSALSCDADLSS